MKSLNNLVLTETDSTPDMFPEYPQPPGVFLLGMKLEVSKVSSSILG
jgi:hypothetical protein